MQQHQLIQQDTPSGDYYAGTQSQISCLAKEGTVGVKLATTLCPIIKNELTDKSELSQQKAI